MVWSAQRTRATHRHGLLAVGLWCYTVPHPNGALQTMLMKTKTKTREELATEVLAEVAQELARICNTKPMTREQTEEISRRST
jgi:hypothetical protein